MLVGLLVAVGLVAGGLAGLGYWLYQRQRTLQYFPTHRDEAGRGTAEFRPWRTPDGAFLGYIREGRPFSEAVVFFCHGNAGEALDRSWVSEMVGPEIAVILYEYPGYGARPGMVSESVILKDAEYALETARKQFQHTSLTVVGESLGSAVACYLAPKADKVALISPFASMVEVASHHYPYLPVRWMLKDRFPSIQYVQQAQAPLHVVHGTLDETIPMNMGKKIFKAYPAKKKEFLELPGCDHSNISDALLYSPFASEFRQFIAGH